MLTTIFILTFKLRKPDLRRSICYNNTKKHSGLRIFQNLIFPTILKISSLSLSFSLSYNWLIKWNQAAQSLDCWWFLQFSHQAFSVKYSHLFLLCHCLNNVGRLFYSCFLNWCRLVEKWLLAMKIGILMNCTYGTVWFKHSFNVIFAAMLIAPVRNDCSPGGGSNRLPYNSRQRLPSTDSDDSSSEEHTPTDGPSADEYKFSESSHANMVSTTQLDIRCCRFKNVCHGMVL